MEAQPWALGPEFMAMNPAGSLPVLRLDDGLTLYGAYAISEYLAEEVPSHPVDQLSVPLFPGDREARAEVRRLVDWFHRKTFDEATTHILEEKLYKRFRSGHGQPPDVGVMRAVHKNLNYTLGFIDYLAQERRWLAGDDLSFADLAAAGQLSCADYLGEVDWSGYASTKLWYARLKSRPAMRAILAERMPGAARPPPYYDDPDF